jgi:hypothetical protein
MTTENLLIRNSRWDLPCDDSKNPELNTYSKSDSGVGKIAESVCAGKENPMFSRPSAEFAPQALEMTIL